MNGKCTSDLSSMSCHVMSCGIFNLPYIDYYIKDHQFSIFSKWHQTVILTMKPRTSLKIKEYHSRIKPRPQRGEVEEKKSILITGPPTGTHAQALQTGIINNSWNLWPTCTLYNSVVSTELGPKAVLNCCRVAGIHLVLSIYQN